MDGDGITLNVCLKTQLLQRRKSKRMNVIILRGMKKKKSRQNIEKKRSVCEVVVSVCFFSFLCPLSFAYPGGRETNIFDWKDNVKE